MWLILHKEWSHEAFSKKIKAGLVLLALTITMFFFYGLHCAGLGKVTTSGVSTLHEDLHSSSHHFQCDLEEIPTSKFSKRRQFVVFETANSWFLWSSGNEYHLLCGRPGFECSHSWSIGLFLNSMPSGWSYNHNVSFILVSAKAGKVPPKQLIITYYLLFYLRL